MGEHKSSPKETLHIDSHAGEDGGGPEPQRAIIAVHPSRLVLAIAVGDELRVYDASDGEVHTLISSGSVAEQSIVTRALAFSRCGRFLATGGDDKMTRLWSCEGWKCLKTLCATEVNVQNRLNACTGRSGSHDCMSATVDGIYPLLPLQQVSQEDQRGGLLRR